MNKDIRIQPEAELDIRDAFNWYQNQYAGLGREFIFSLDTAMLSISRTPTIYPKIYNDIRRTLIKRFPFGIFYLNKRDEIIVLAVIHIKRNPIIWQKRL